ncbi:MAG: methionine--tRNA ligase, partial [Thermoplasmata archaeon]|nr:methionine--tRNA ligase [Thermoplasmata archaeon]
QDLFLTLLERGYIYPKTTTELYCEKCGRFLPDRYVTGTCPYCGQEGTRGDQCDACSTTYEAMELIDPVCRLCGSTPVPRETEHFFLRLSSFNERLLDYLEDKGHWRSRVWNFTRNWLTQGLRDRPITRDISWGVPVPLEGYEGKCIYVWFDAVTGYLSTSKLWAEKIGDPDAWRKFWLDPKAKSYYFLGKDNVPFHAIIWPAMLLGLSEGKGEDYNLPYDVPANEYLRLEGEKFTKSGGIGVEVARFMRKYTSDEVRYYLSIIMPENRDVNFDMEEFRVHINNELVATLGNFIHRVVSFTARNYGKLPHAGELSEKDREALAEIKKAGEQVSGHIEGCEFKNALKGIMSLAAYGNRYLGERAPWHLFKSNREECRTVLNVGMKMVKALSVMAYPFLPESMSRLHSYLGFDATPDWEEVFRDFTPARYSMELPLPKPLFRVLKLEKKKKQDEKRAEKSRKTGLEHLDLRIGLVKEVKDHPDAEKLYILSIDVGEDDSRTLVAGLKPYYPPEGLIGRRMVIVCNLKPARLRGVLSQGMLLAAEKDEMVVFLTPVAEEAPGTRVSGHIVSPHSPPQEITIQEFSTVPMTVRRVEKVENGKIVLESGDELDAGELDTTELTGKKVVVVRGGILCAGKGLVVPEREIEAGARIR